MFPFIVGGLAMIGGGIVLLLRPKDEVDTKNLPDPESKNVPRNPQVSSYDLDKVRQARRELRYQMRQKKKITSTGSKSNSNGEDE